MKLKRILAAVAVSLGMICVKSQSVSAEMMYRLYNPHTSEHFFYGESDGKVAFNCGWLEV
ncbi:hypothetical protein [Enterococcus cecorum]|uniref:hypothetical protein n=1 Tax=Enterococcus cecorum TaxID=44008 RepID=UPI0006597121|nr:hypothetical protein [Enterococcus cecorum]KLO70699.1 hypothetical protein AA987_05840 [Enterococcus cecorum]MDZ5500810.1 hypothetical protein [Enterococcus cecorum]CAI3413877.1 hypothetical protein CIRMBP1313_00915 [Enterococcus cecorum]